MRVEDGQLKAFLLDTTLINRENLEKAEREAKKSGTRLADMLLTRGLLPEEDLVKLQAYILGIPFVNIEALDIPREVLTLIPEPIARKNNIVAFRRQDADLEVAMLDPEDLQTIDFIRKTLRLKILPRLTTSASIKAVLKQYSKTLEAEFGEMIQAEARGMLTTVPITGEHAAPKAEELKKAAEELPIVRIVDTLVKHAILEGASDIHIEPMEKEVIVRYRIDGILHDAMTLPMNVRDGIVARLKVLSSLKLDEHRLPQDGRFKVETEDFKYSLRISVLPVFDGEKIVMRLLPESAHGFTFEELGLFGESSERIERGLRRPVGMILVTGPTGSGKTTTLYSMLEILNRPGVNISTIEDPVEYRMPRVNQTQVRPEIGLTFANGLRSLVRQDPDIVMVGEIRDKETASLAINAALTGHLVLSTLHTNSSAGAIPRLLDMGVEPFLLSSTLNAVIGQRLVRRLCPEHESYTFTAKERVSIEKSVDIARLLSVAKQLKLVGDKTTFEDIPFFHPKPSKECPDGYHGRVGIYEVLEVNEAMRILINRRATIDEIFSYAQKHGMVSMVEDGILKALQGLTTLEEVLRVIAE